MTDPTRRRRCMTLALVAWILPAARVHAQAVESPNVLTIHSGAVDFLPNPVLDAGIREGLFANGRPRPIYFTEYLEFDRFPDVGAAPALADYIERKYKGRTIDMVIAVTSRSMTFVLDYRQRLFPEAAVVFAGAGINHDDLVRAAGPAVTGVMVGNAYSATLKLALQLHPGTRTAHIVAIAPDQRSVETVQRELEPFSRQVRLVYVNAASETELAAAVRAIPSTDAILYIWYQQPGEGYVTDPQAPMRLVANAAAAPVYSVVDTGVGTGAVGGVVRDVRGTGIRVGQIAREILDGRPASAVPFEYAPLVPIFDWRQLRRWRIDEARLPAGAEIRFRVPTAWEAYRVYIMATLAVVAAQLVLIAALLAQHAKRRRAEHKLRRREATLRTSYERIRLLAGELIRTQEATRANVARDLHDDICQDLVGVSVGISSLMHTPGPIQEPDVQRRLSDLQAWALQVVESVRRLSHELHPASLQLIGLASALRTHCVEVERRYDVQVSFHASGTFRSLEPDTAVCLFRIAQEALRNGATHGDARRLGVLLARSGDHIELTVTDDGVGFDLERVRRGRGGLGLVSMEERARLVGGDVEVVTAPGEGTAIRARVPARLLEEVVEDDTPVLAGVITSLPTEESWTAHR